MATNAGADTGANTSAALPIDMNRINRMRAVTISRQYGSGGGEVAARLARRLGWQLVDHEIVAQVAARMGLPEADAEEFDERGESLIERLLAGMSSVEPALPGMGSLAVPDEQVYREALRAVVESAAATGHVVIVGRGGQMLLSGQRDVVHVRVVAPLEERITYVMRREGLSRGEAEARIQLKDRSRTRYMQSAFRVNLADAEHYDLIVNTVVLDLDSVVDLVELALDRKAQRLGAPASALGPAAGMGEYPGHAEDLQPPSAARGR